MNAALWVFAFMNRGGAAARVGRGMSKSSSKSAIMSCYRWVGEVFEIGRAGCFG